MSHQDPGLLDHVVNKKADRLRFCLPPDANTLLYVADCSLRSRDLINVTVAGKSNQPQLLDLDAVVKQREADVGIWE